MFDARTAVGIARSEGVDLRFFLKPPNWHLSPSREVMQTQNGSQYVKYCNI